MFDDLLMFALDPNERDLIMWRCILGVLYEDGDIVQNEIIPQKERPLSSQGTRTRTYCELNPELSVHSSHISRDVFDDRWRIAFTRVRLSFHGLKVETGR